MEVGSSGGETEEIVCRGYDKRPYRRRGNRVGLENLAGG